MAFTLDNTSVLSFLIQQPCKVEQGLFTVSHFRCKLLGLETKQLTSTQSHTGSEGQAQASDSVFLSYHRAVPGASISSHHFPLVNVSGGVQPWVVLQIMSRWVEPAGNVSHSSSEKIVVLGLLRLTTSTFELGATGADNCTRIQIWAHGEGSIK